MNIRLISKHLPIACLLSTSLAASQVYADWSSDEPYRGYNKSFGDFPPVDIDRQLSASVEENTKPEENAQQAGPATATPGSTQPAVNQAQNYSGQQFTAQQFQQPAYGGYYQNRYYAPPGAQRYNRGSSFSTPWDNNRSSFSSPWNNRGSSFSMPWDNGRTSFSGPWNNNNRSGFRPWGNGGSWSW
jgi:hypothetical protein